MILIRRREYLHARLYAIQLEKRLHYFLPLLLKVGVGGAYEYLIARFHL